MLTDLERVSPMPRVDVIVVLWNSVAFLPELFASVAALDYPRDRMRLHIVDNNPGDGSLDAAKHLMEQHGDRLPTVIIHEPQTNTGFAGGNNLAIGRAIQDGVEFVYLLNHDAAFEPLALREAVRVAEMDSLIGAVQSLMVLAQNVQEVNSRGNAIHYLGFGYCMGYHDPRGDVQNSVTHIAYASGAAILLPTRVLKEIGLFDETLWLYHEDLDLGWRILLAGYRNVLAPKSVVRHHYDFSRSISKWYWMERNRMAVVFKNYHVLTLLLLVPQLIVADIAILSFAIAKGWWREKLRATAWFFRPQTWSYLLRERHTVARLRKVSDRHILTRMTPVLAYQEFEDPFITTIVNPAWRFLFKMLKSIVVW